MKSIFFLFNCLWSGLAFPLEAQSLSHFDLQLDTISIPGLPGLHSFAAATHADKWLFIGGRLDGMHQKFNAFPASNANQQIFVVAPASGTVWQRPLTELPDTLREQLSSTNMSFFQQDGLLLFTGGYGRSEALQNHITYPYLTRINVAGLMDAVMNGGPLKPNFQQIRDTFFAVTGGQLQPLADTFYLVGGHRFDGIYSANSANPTQFYANSIRKFTLASDQADLQVLHKSKIVDELQLHRRDYNLTPQVFPDGEWGLTAFSGVFQPGISLSPFLNLVEIRSSGHAPVNGFSQFLANYHCAKVPLWAQSANETHTLFFGGISNYWLDENDSLRKDNRLPFVKTISRVSRLQDGTYQELPFAAELPWYTGAGAEFMLAPGVPTLLNGMVDYDQLPDGQQLLGYIVGGIVTPDHQPNPFVANTIGITSASSRLIKVFLEKNLAGSLAETPLDGHFDLRLAVHPNPASDCWNVRLTLPRSGCLRTTLQDAQGCIVARSDGDQYPAGATTFPLLAAGLPAGAYWLTVNLDGIFMETKTILKH